jgi:hypothetical protein
MYLDALVNFGAVLGSPFSFALANGVYALPTVIDLFGNGVGQAPTSIYGRTSNAGPGADMGIDIMRPELFVQIGTAGVTATAAQLNVHLQAAADTGLAGNSQPGAWQVLGESGYLTAAQLATSGAYNGVIFRSPWLPAFPQNLNPRFVRLAVLIGTQAAGTAAAVSFTAGTISWAGVTQGRDDYASKFTPKNYSV